MRKAAPALAIVLCFAAGWAKAEDVCATLDTRLAALDRLDRAAWEGSGNADEAVAQKRRELDQATAEARRAGCIGGIFARLHSAGRCAALNARIDRLTAALDRLAAERRALGADPYAAERERSAVIQAMSAQGCRGGEAQDVRRERRANRLFATLFGGTRPFRSGRWDDELSLPFDLSFGTYRTLCVRTCDGYYFPISFAASGAALYRDAAACRALCPRAKVALYVHRSPGEDAARMVSLAGEPYTALPAAFRYRREYDPSCRCGALTATGRSRIGRGRLCRQRRQLPRPRMRRSFRDPRSGRAGSATPKPRRTASGASWPETLKTGPRRPVMSMSRGPTAD
jgi:hypothetical protein